jgi:two-component system, response regulator YesN
MRAWPLMLKREDGRSLEAEIRAFLRKVSASIDSPFLVRFMHDFMQVLYSALKSGGLPAHDAFADNLSAGLSSTALRSVAGMENWAGYAIGRTVEALRRKESEDTPVGLAKDYIAKNLTKNLSREEIAARIGLNPDYLSRVFKKETGMSPVEWIVAERLEYARSLLLKTDLSVGDIAVQVGYSNFSHFSAIFKKRFGLNPRDFKRSVLE